MKVNREWLVKAMAGTLQAVAGNPYQFRTASCTVCGRGRYDDSRHAPCNHQLGGDAVFCSCHRYAPKDSV